MLLKNITLINWHQYPAVDIAINGQIIGLIGDNGVGKSTMSDAIHLIMAGGGDSVKLNKRANNDKSGTNNKDKRSIHSYCLGRSENGVYLRDTANTYLLAGYEDPHGKKPPITLLICYYADKSETKHHIQSRSVIKGLIVRKDDIITSSEDGEKIVEPWDVVRTRLSGKLAILNGSLETYQSAQDYVKSHLRLLMYKGRFDIHKQFLMNLDNGISFNSVGSATEFIQNYVLNENRIEIDNLKSAVVAFNQLTGEVKIIGDQITAVDGLLETLKTRENYENQEDLSSAIVAMSSAMISRRKRRQFKRQIVDFEKQYSQCTLDYENSKLEEKSYKHDIDKSMKILDSMGSKDEIVRLNDKIKACQNELDHILPPLIGEDGIGKLAHTIRYKSSHLGMSEDLISAFVRLNDMVSHIENTDLEYFPAQPELADDALQNAAKLLAQYKSEVENLYHKSISDSNKLSDDLRERRAELENIKANGVIHSRETTDFLQSLLSVGVEAKVLCDLVEVKDENWRGAIESLLGSNRDIIFVKPNDFDAASRILSENKSQYKRIKVANTVKLSRHQMRGRSGVISDVLDINCDLAAALIDIKFGNVFLAENERCFRRDGRWILPNGLFDDGTSIGFLRETQPRLGKNAQIKYIPILESNIQEIASRCSAANSLKQEFCILNYAVIKMDDMFKKMNVDSMIFSTAKRIVDENKEKIDQAKKNIDRIEGDIDTSAIDAEIKSLHEELALHEKNSIQLLNNKIRFEYQLKEAQKNIDGSGDILGSNLNVSAANGNYRACMSNLKYPSKKLDYLYSMYRQIDHCDDIAQISKNAKKNGSIAHDKLLSSNGDAVTECNTCIDMLGARHLFREEFRMLEDVYPWALDRLEILKTDTLLLKKEELERYREESERLFYEGFLNELASRFDDAKAHIKNLNKAIGGTEFINDKYSFSIIKSPEFAAFHKVVEHRNEIHNSVSEAGMFRSPVSQDVLDAQEEVKRIIYASDEFVNLDAYTDYRRYFTFEINIKNSITGASNTLKSRKASGSGGEVQTPYYICMMAAMSNVYYGGPYKGVRDKDGGLALAIFDEAFSNMDDTVSAKMVDLARELGLQILIIGPTRNKIPMQKNCDTVLTVTKTPDGKSTKIYPEEVKDKARTELIKINPAQMSDDRIIELMQSRTDEILSAT